MAREDLPVFQSPFSARINVHRELVWSRARAWLRRTGLVQSDAAMQRAESIDYSELGARTWPDAGPDELELVTCWVIWLFMIDDQFDDCHLGERRDDARALVEGCERVLTCPIDSAYATNPVEAGLLDIWTRVAPHMSPRLQERFSRHTRHYVRSLLWEVENRVERKVPDLLAYAEARRDTGAVLTIFDLIEYANRAELSPALCRNPLVETLRVCAMDNICMINDIISHDKESARGEVNNYVCVCQHWLGCDTRTAMQYVNELQARRTALFLQSKEKLESDLGRLDVSEAERSACARYVAGLESWMQGNLDFSLGSARYFEVEASVQGRRVSWIDNIGGAPDDALIAPLFSEVRS